eukprot:jgi/Botrbrau1/211/Bobra.0022s0191.1
MAGTVAWSEASTARGLYNISYVQDGERQALLSCGADGKILLYGETLHGTPKQYKAK